MISAVAIVALKVYYLGARGPGNDPQDERPNGGGNALLRKTVQRYGRAKELAPCDTTITVCKTATGFLGDGHQISWSVVKS